MTPFNGAFYKESRTQLRIILL